MSESVLSATKILRQILMADETVSDMVKSTVDGVTIYKIFPLRAPADTDGDFILYCRTGYEINDANMMLSVREKSTVTLNVVSAQYDAGVTVAEAIRSALIDHKAWPTLKVRIIDANEDTVGWPDGATTKYVQIIVVEITDI
jgi:hypothetical protein